jgi:uncharacterized protein (TIGR02099 family)
MTNTAQHSFAFRLWIQLRGLLAVLIVLFGVVVGVISLILPNESLYKDKVVSFLSKQWDKEIVIEHISGKWRGFGPSFVIEGLKIKDEEEVAVDQAILTINFVKFLIPKGSTGINLEISDVDVDFERKPSGKIVLADEVDMDKGFSDKIGKLLDAGTLTVNNLTLNITDPVSQAKHKIKSKITVQQSNEQRAFVLELDTKEIADVISLKAITAKGNDFLKQAQWYVESKNLSLQSISDYTNNNYFPKTFVDAQLWVETENSSIIKMVATANLKNKLFENDAEVTGQAKLIYKGNKNKWLADLTIKDIKTASISQDEINVRINRDKGFINLEADVLDVPLLRAILSVVHIDTTSFDSFDLTGKVADVSIKYDVNLRRIVDASIAFEKINMTTNVVQLTNLTGSISFHDEQIRLLIDSENGSAHIPGILRGNVEWSNLLLTAQTSMQDNDIDVKINSVWCDCNDFVLDGAARIGFDENLFLDLTFAIYQAQANQLYKYWPTNKWKPKVLNFLDQALVSGVVENGMIIYHGMTKDYPFKASQGVFITQSNLHNAQVKYHKDWPILSAFNAVVDTKNMSLRVKSQEGRVMNARIKNVLAQIKDFKKPYLTVDVNAKGKDNYLLDFLKSSPMKKGLKILDEDMSLKGRQEAQVHLGFPLNKPTVKIEPSGSVNFIHTDFQVGHFQLLDLVGKLDFAGLSLKLSDLKAKFLNQSAVVSGDIVNQANQPTKINVLINGNYDVTNFESTLGFELPAIGRAPWKFSIANSKQAQTVFTANSNLIGVQLDIPAPFTKTIEESTPFSLSCVLPCLDSGWDLSFNQSLTSNFSVNRESGEFKLNKLIFGKTQDMFGGHLGTVDIDKWISLLTKNKSQNKSQNLPFQNMSLQVDTIIFMARELKDVNIDVFNNIKDDSIDLTIQAEDVSGTVKIANNLSKKGIIVQLQKLHWQAPDVVKAEESSEQVTTSYPPLHIWIGDFIYDGIPLGESSIEVRPVSEGIKVEKLVTHSELLNLNINGVWSRNLGKKGVSKFNIIMTSRNIAAFLKKLGFQAPISHTQTLINMQAQWDGLPSGFEIKNISGSMRIELGKGEVVDTKPGMGRVLGLFSLTNLPRRLILDFSDVFAKGLQFQSMKGDFELREGDAYTDAFIIDSSSARISLSGRTGLAAQDYDQTIIIEPRVGRILPTIGAITGGAVGAAAGFLVQGMFHKGLKDVGKIIYKVTGSWDEPNIVLVETKKRNEK